MLATKKAGCLASSLFLVYRSLNVSLRMRLPRVIVSPRCSVTGMGRLFVYPSRSARVSLILLLPGLPRNIFYVTSRLFKTFQRPVIRIVSPVFNDEIRLQWEARFVHPGQYLYCWETVILRSSPPTHESDGNMWHNRK